MGAIRSRRAGARAFVHWSPFFVPWATSSFHFGPLFSIMVVKRWLYWRSITFSIEATMLLARGVLSIGVPGAVSPGCEMTICRSAESIIHVEK